MSDDALPLTHNFSLREESATTLQQEDACHAMMAFASLLREAELDTGPDRQWKPRVPKGSNALVVQEIFRL